MNTHLPFGKKGAARFGKTSRTLALLAALGLPTLAPAQNFVFPRNASFTGKDANGFTLGGNAFLTATGAMATDGVVSGTALDADGSGVLRLTNATSNPQQAGYAIDNSTFDTPKGFSISFEFFAYGTNSQADVPADGFTVFLVDGKGTAGSDFQIGGFGGSLGYAPRVRDTSTEPGVTKGYLGIGIDEYGNYGITSEGKTGGYLNPATQTYRTTLLPNAVSLRGPYDSTDVARTRGYAYLTGSNSLPFDLAVGTSKANQGSRITVPTDAGYRKAYINVIPFRDDSGKTIYKITVRIQNGQNVATAVNSFTVVNPPPTLRVGFGASTGGANSIHEIRGLAIVQAPIAVDDNVQTKYGQPVVIGVLDNDQDGGGAAIDLKTVDLNPNTIGLDNSYLVAGKGTFELDNQGVVTFTPVAGFAGTVSIPYTVLNFNKNLSNLGNINVIVTGADVQTVVSGPAVVPPGATTAYAVTTTNNGQETAINVRPTLTLPAGFTLVGQLPAGADQSTSGGITTITFAPATLLAQQAVASSVQVQAPGAMGSYALTSNYAYPPGAVVPDAVPANNSSTLTVSVQASAYIAGACAVPGKDGPATLGAGTVPNTYYPGVAALKGNRTLTVGTAPTGSTTPIAAGDLVLIMQMQGAKMTLSADKTDANYGTVNTATAGTYEYAVAAGAVAGNGSLSLVSPLINSYTNVSATDANTAFQQFQVIRVPQYSALTLTGAVKGLAWNGSTGGILALEVAGQTSFTSGTLNMDGAGFRGGAGIINASGGDTRFYVAVNGGNNYAAKGEGIGGTPVSVFNGTAAAVSGGSSTYQNYAIGSYARGKAATGGGGGLYTTQNAVYGGGGGANGGGGGMGASPPNATDMSGGGGGVAYQPSATTLYLGGGGGAGASTASTPANALRSSGGLGGGIIVLRSGSVTGTASISANGQAGDGGLAVNAGGGGGAGGTVVLRAGTGLGNLTVTANGGNGTTTSGAQSIGGNGGGGGGGLILSNSAVKSSSAAAGANGTGAAAGVSNANTPIGGDCQPALTATLSTTTPKITRSGNMTATYVYTVANTGGGIMGLTASPSLAGAVSGAEKLFKYVSITSAVVRLTDGTNQTLAASDYTVDNSIPRMPTFTLTPSYVVPAGASVVFTFVASVDNAVATGTAYGSNATGSYLDPQRATATTTAATPAYVSGTTGVADVVTIVAPLPVTLTTFTAVAVGTDAVLSWTTAQEVNNHHFEVERSLDGHAFEGLGTVAGHGTTALTSGYAFTDAGASARTTGVLYYRLRQVDYEGQTSLSPVQAVRFRHAAGASNVALYPNPATNSATLDLSALPAGDYFVQVLETTGRLVRSGTYQPGKQKLLLDGLATGTYFVKVQGASFNLVLPLSKH